MELVSGQLQRPGRAAVVLGELLAETIPRRVAALRLWGWRPDASSPRGSTRVAVTFGRPWGRSPAFHSWLKG